MLQLAGCGPVIAEQLTGYIFLVLVRALIIWYVYMIEHDDFIKHEDFMKQRFVLYVFLYSYGNIFHVTGPLWGESTDHWWIPLSKASDI